ncbi:MAG: EAL domain-containing protein [Caulobacteraceae bacterium]|nr:EAL domain-containing protein [Caulobacteraceae bacterium]
MAVDPFRFLGLAFATADLLLEIDENGVVTFAAGAGQRLTQTCDADLIGRSWLGLFAEADQPTAAALLAGVEDGERRGVDKIGLTPDPDGECRLANLSAFRLPQIAPRVSCALTLATGPATQRVSRKLFDRTAFESAAKALIEASHNSGPDLEVGLIEFGGLDRERKRLSPEAADALDLRLAGALRAEAYGDAAAELGEQRFAVLRRKGDAPDAVIRRLTRVLGAGLEPTAQTLAVDPKAPPTRLMRALRFALDDFLAEGAPGAANLSDVLNTSVRKTVAEAGAFGAMVDERRFKLVYQPVISLADGRVRHYEALVRFAGEQSPFAQIRLAEELDIIEDLDLAVAEEAVKRLRSDRGGQLRLAVNVSGRTIVSPSYVQALSELSRPGDLNGRMIFEITESAAIADLPLAQRHVQALQSFGHQVCLDDFGAGAASFAYLQQLKVDVVKIDGSYVRELTSSGRDDAMIRHLVNLCRELKAETVAEMVETKAVEDILRRAGVDCAQGWLYGQPCSEPTPPTRSAAAMAARRVGVKETWG